MDLLNPNVPLNLYDNEWKIYARNPGLPPHFVAKGADVQNSMITEGCEIWGTVDFSVLFSGVTVEKGAVVKDSIVMPGCVIKAGARVEYSILAENCVIGEDCVIGQRPEDMENLDEWGVAVVGSDSVLDAGSVVKPKEMLDSKTMGKVG